MTASVATSDVKEGLRKDDQLSISAGMVFA